MAASPSVPPCSNIPTWVRTRSDFVPFVCGPKSRSSALKGSDSIFGMLNVNAKPLDSNQPITSPKVCLLSCGCLYWSRNYARLHASL
jgi:hypothetical protein